MTLSILERLPPELIQPIFLLSGPNLALPLTSSHIATKLSDDYIYHEVCAHHLLRKLDILAAEQSESQTGIFAAKWMTWEFFKSFIIKTYEGCGCLCGKTPERGCFDAQWPPNFEDATEMVFSRSHLPSLVWVKCRLPIKLLHGPWTKDKIQFLRFLLWTTSMTVDWADLDVRRLALEGKKEAILQRNLEVVETFNHNRRLGNAPRLDTIRFIVMEAGCDRSILYDTMDTARAWGLRSDNWKCPELDAWCEERIQAGDPKGKWLQIKLRELRTFNGNMDPHSGNYDGGEDDRLVIRKHRWNETYAQHDWLARYPKWP